MKKLKVGLFLFFLALTINCGAQGLLQVNDGVYRLAQDTAGWVNTGIAVQENLIEYSFKFSEAISNPGKNILVKTTERGMGRVFPFKRKIEIKKYYLKYDFVGKSIDIYAAKPLIKIESSYSILLLVAAIILLIIFEKKKLADGLYAIPFIAAILFSLFNVFNGGALNQVYLFSLLAALIGFIVLKVARKHKASVVLFCVFMFINILSSFACFNS